MANYLWGILSDVMMRETAGIQACFDFDSEEDAMQKFRVANMLSPIATAMFARDDKIFSVNGTMTLRQFMTKEYQGFIANLDDFKLSANLYFPDVRLRKFIEIRNHDCVGKGLQYSIIAFYKGIMYSKTILNEVDEPLHIG